MSESVPAPSRWVKAFDYLFLIRPTLMYPLWIFFLAGRWSGGRQALVQVSGMDAFLIGAGLTCVMSAVYIVNQIQDQVSDRINRKLFLICDGHVPVKNAYIESAVFAAAGISLGFFADFRAGCIMLFLLFMAAFIYSYPPARMKDRPIGGLIVNGLGGMFIFVLGWISAGGRGWIPMQAIAYFGASAAVMLNTTMPDIRGDREAGKITFAVKYGVRLTVVWALVIEVITVILALYFKEWVLFIPGISMVPLFIYALSRKKVADVVRATKYAVFAMAFVICVIFPWFLLPVFVIFFGSRWYYKKRFGFDYPNLKAN